MNGNNETAFATALPKIILNGQGQSQNVLGDVQTIKLSGKDTDGLFTVVENYNEPGVGIPMHIHENEDEIFHIIEGQMEFETQGKTTLLSKGDMIFLPRMIPHAFKVVGNVKCKAIVTVIPSGIEEMFESLAALPPGPPDFEKVSAICARQGIRFL
ncbi:cupin domain-containing protein [Flavobacterium selenitireducens]|uniref:cupin domain-containing protein n=1 Tax=Flavobacterium selenitireducens TaxID=2722704 RepID=UPI00168B1DB0|nr:cupin domain-containing protein [Flavobacterium selenitireducens]MBD3581443.1 cupin domain-containing protein [Flavobacterium selenitireducens]